jgi:hypothetical protein
LKDLVIEVSTSVYEIGTPFTARGTVGRAAYVGVSKGQSDELRDTLLDRHARCVDLGSPLLAAEGK